MVPGAERHHGDELLRAPQAAPDGLYRCIMAAQHLDRRSAQLFRNAAVATTIPTTLRVIGGAGPRRLGDLREQGGGAAALRQVGKAGDDRLGAGDAASRHPADPVVHRISRLQREVGRRLSRHQRDHFCPRPRRDRHDGDRQYFPDPGSAQQRPAQDPLSDRRAQGRPHRRPGRSRRGPAVSGPDERQDQRPDRGQGLRSVDHAQYRRQVAGAAPGTPTASWRPIGTFERLAGGAGIPRTGREDQRRFCSDVGARRGVRGGHAGGRAERGSGLHQSDDESRHLLQSADLGRIPQWRRRARRHRACSHHPASLRDGSGGNWRFGDFDPVGDVGLPRC